MTTKNALRGEPIVLETPFGFFPKPHAIELGEVHTVMTREEVTAIQQAATDKVKSGSVYAHLRAIANHCDPIETSFGIDPISSRIYFTIHEISVMGDINIESERSAGYGRFGYGSRPTGKMRLKIGWHPETKNYPQRKDGTFNYEAAAQELGYIAARRRNLRRAENNRSRNESKVKMLRMELGVNEYASDFSLRPSQTNSETPIFFEIKMQGAVSYERAREIHAALKSVGLVK